MKILLIVSSTHRQNTMKIAEAMAEAGPVTVADLVDIGGYNLNDYDILGFGSGIYAGKFGKKLLAFIKSAEFKTNNTFVFSTSGTGNFEKYNKQPIKLLESKGKTVLGSFGCKGLCKWFIFGLVGGIAKNHPDEKDFDDAQNFLSTLL